MRRKGSRRWQLDAWFRQNYAAALNEIDAGTFLQDKRQGLTNMAGNIQPARYNKMMQDTLRNVRRAIRCRPRAS